MPEPLTPETLAEIREMAGYPLQTQIDMAVVLRQRELLLAEVDRLAAAIAEAERLAAERDEARRSADTWRQCHDRHAAEADRLQAERDQLRARLSQAWTATEALADELGYPLLGDLRAALLIDGRAPASKGAHDA